LIEEEIQHDKHLNVILNLFVGKKMKSKNILLD